MYRGPKPRSSMNATTRRAGAHQPSHRAVRSRDDPLVGLRVRLVPADLGLSAHWDATSGRPPGGRQGRAGVVQVGDLEAPRGVVAEAVYLEREVADLVGHAPEPTMPGSAGGGVGARP